MSDLQSLLRELGESRISEISGALGADEKSARSALSMGLPVILGALARNASKPGGADALASALDRDHDGSALDDLTSVLGGARNADGEGILRHALGAKRGTVEQALGKQSGLDPSQVAKLMGMLAPLVMAHLGRAKKTNGLDAGGLTDLLRREGGAVASKGPELGGLAALLDRDGDGSIADEIGGIAKGLLGNLMKGRG
jgi:hypothetical protein